MQEIYLRNLRLFPYTKEIFYTCSEQSYLKVKSLPKMLTPTSDITVLNGYLYSSIEPNRSCKRTKKLVKREREFSSLGGRFRVRVHWNSRNSVHVTCTCVRLVSGSHGTGTNDLDPDLRASSTSAVTG